MLHIWMGNTKVVNLILIIIALVGLAFQINSSEQSLRFAKKVYKTLGRVAIGTFAMLIRSPILFFLQKAGNETGLNWQELFSRFSLQSLLLAIIFGSIVSFVVSNAPTFWKSLIKSIVVCNILLLLLDVILKDLIQQFQLQNIFNVVVTNTIIGILVALLLNIFNLRSNRFVTIMKNPFYE